MGLFARRDEPLGEECLPAEVRLHLIECDINRGAAFQAKVREVRAEAARRGRKS